MRLYENEAKQIFEKEGIPIPRFYGVVGRAAEIRERPEMRFPVMIKSLVLIGGRGKAGGVQKAKDADEAVSLAGKILGRRIGGYAADRVLVEEVVDGVAACYVGVTMNPADFNLSLIVSPAGGVDI